MGKQKQPKFRLGRLPASNGNHRTKRRQTRVGSNKERLTTVRITDMILRRI